jgi:hypothetical protein
MPSRLKKAVFLEYAFLFDPSATWAHLHEFEKDLAVFFAQHGLEAEILNAMTESGKRILHIRKRPDIGPPPQPGKGQSIGTRLNKMSNKKIYKRKR